MNFQTEHYQPVNMHEIPLKGKVTLVTGRFALRLAPRIRRSEFVSQLGLFDVHVLELAGLEDFRTFQAFNKFRVLIAGDDPHTRMLALRHAISRFGDCDGGIEVINPVCLGRLTLYGAERPQLAVFLGLATILSSPFE
jgi:hypothetical protein